MPRKKGNVTPVFSLKVGAGSAVDFGSELVSIEFADGDGNQVTFSDYASGNAAVQATASFVLDTATASAWEYHWTNSGASNVTYVFQFESGAVSQTNPKITGTLTMPPKPRFSHEAGDSTTTTTFEMTYQLDTYTKAIA